MEYETEVTMFNVNQVVFYHQKEIYVVVDKRTSYSDEPRIEVTTYGIQHIKTKRIIGNVDASELSTHPTLDLLYGKNNTFSSKSDFSF